MTGDSVDCFNCGRSNPSWAQVCRSCGVPMRPGGAGARPPSGPFPTDRESLLSIGGGLATMVLAIGLGLMLSGLLPEAASVIATPTPMPSVSLVPSPSVQASPSQRPEPTPKPTPEPIGRLTFGLGLNESTMEVTDETNTFDSSDQFCHSIRIPDRFRVRVVKEEVLKIEDDGSRTIVQSRQEGENEIDKDARVVGFCVPGQSVINEWGTGEFIMRDYRARDGLELLAEGRFTLNP